MLKKNTKNKIYLIDTNVIIRFITKDNSEHYGKALEIFTKIENNELQVEILDVVIMESIFVLDKAYKSNLRDIIKDLSNILGLKGVVGDKFITLESLNLMQEKKIDFADALICTKNKLQNYGKISFDKDVINC